MTRAPHARLGLCLLALGSCRPDFGERVSRIEEPRVLAVRADPPEAAPGGAPVTMTLLVAGAHGDETPSATFSFCATPKLLTENGAVSAACLADGVQPIGEGRGSITAPLPPDGCFLFGPETKEAEVRPRDPDPTGGFYQPVRAVVSAGGGAAAGPLVAFGFVRLRCKLGSAPADAAGIFARDYRPNANPSAPVVTASIDGAPAALDALPRGARVTLRAAWRPEDAEGYVAFDPRSQTVVPRRESMRVSWFATAGDFEHDRTGRGEEETETFTENAWTSPEGEATLWVVLRDSRGGVSFARHALRAR